MSSSLQARPSVPVAPRRSTASAAVAVGLIGAVFLAVAPVLVVAGPSAGEAVTAAAIVAAVCAAAAPVLALLALLRRRPAAAGALLAGAGAVALGLAVMDLQLWESPIDANRLELFRPLTAARLDAGPGAVAVLLGHGLAVLAGVLGMVTVARAAEADGYGRSDFPDHDGAAVGRRIGAPLSAAAATAALILAAALCAAPLHSADPVLLMRPLLGSPAATAIGTALVAVAVLVVVAAALVSVSPAVASGALLGAATAALGLVGSRLVAGLVADGVSAGPGPVAGTLAALALVAVAAAVPVVAPARARRGLDRLLSGPARRSGDPVLGRKAAESAARARLDRRHAVAGVATVAAGVLAVVGALLPLLALPAGVPEPRLLVTRLALVAGATLVVAGAWLLLSEFAALVRPAVGVLWAAQVMAVAAALQAVVVASDLPGAGPGLGAVVLGLSAVAATVAGIAVAIAGSVERDGIDTSAPPEPRTAVLAIGVPAALASVAGLALPLYRGTDFGPASVAQWPWGWDLWGRALLAVVVATAVWVAARSRPARAASLLVGSAVGMGIYLIGWPLTSARVAEPVAGLGAVGAILGVVLLGAAAVVAVRPRR
ncbi:hypothetical protein [Rhodococcus tukisamuensis]|uniref:hypothetical protein n=1 Tax=Rhodococcus tukisamuensis TaxID=168276 RepID=UPI000932429F|nr:hypothetical protein [Rhodococcus tukisamuensis]